MKKIFAVDDEWKELNGYVDSYYGIGHQEWDNIGYIGFDAGYSLKSSSGWFDNGNGSNEYGFNAIPNGTRSTEGGFGSLLQRI